MSAEILKFSVQPRKIAEKIELRTYTLIEQYFDVWRLWFTLWGMK